MTYNPDTPCALGPQWFPTTEPAIPLTGYAQSMGTEDPGGLRAGGAVLSSTVTETIELVNAGFVTPAGTMREGSYELEVYEADNLPSSQILQQTFVPGSDVTAANITGWDGSVDVPTAPFYVHVDDANLADYIYPVDPGDASRMGFGASLIDGALDDRLITLVQVTALVTVFSDEGERAATFVPYMDVGGIRSDNVPITHRGTSVKTIRGKWWVNPATGVSWKGQDLDNFDSSTGTDAFGVKIQSVGDGTSMTPRVHAVYLEVYYSSDATDPRVAVATWSIGDSRFVGWNEAEIGRPDGTGPWEKNAATDYLFVLRRRAGRGDGLWRFLHDPERPLTTPAWRRVDPVIAWESNLVARVDEHDTSAPALILVDDVGDCSVDSQPYLSINDEGGPQTPFQNVWTRVNTAATLEQEITVPTPGGDQYGFFRLLVSLDQPTTDEDLVVQILDRATDTPQGSPATFTPNDVKAPRQSWQILEGRVAGVAPTLNDEQYYLRITSDAAEGEGWRVQVLSTLQLTSAGAPPACAPEVTFGGDIDTLTVLTVERNTLDAAITMHTIPDPVEDVVVVTTDLGHPGGCTQGVTLSWTPTAVNDCGLGFSRYEIQHSLDEVEWKDIQYVLVEATDEWLDLEAPRNVESFYRMRVRREDGAASDWSESLPITPEQPCCGFLLASNELGEDWLVWYDDIAPRSWVRPQEEATHAYHGRNYKVRWGQLEDPGDSFNMTLVVGSLGGLNGTQAAAVNGRAAFDLLCKVASSQNHEGAKLTPSYIAVLDSMGNRWLASLSIGDMTYDAESGELHTAVVSVVQVTDNQSVGSSV